MKFDLPKDQASIIKVIGVGGGGSNAVNHMYNQGITGVDFVICNTDAQALELSPIPNKIQLGTTLTEGLGAGANPEVGKNAAIEDIENIKAILENNTKMVFITAGMGGGTGTGAAPVIAQTAREMGILTVGIVTIPFSFEGRRRKQQADEGLQALRDNVDTMLVINNDKLRMMHGNLKMGEAFSKADDILTIAAKGIAEIITVAGYINVDFEDVKTVMKDGGTAIMGSATAEGEERAIKAVSSALASPLLNDNEIKGANFILLNVTSGEDEITMDEIDEITDYIQNEAGYTAELIWGNGTDESLGNSISVTVIATGFGISQNANVEFGVKPEKIVHSLENDKPVVNEVKETTSETTIENSVEEPYLKPAEVQPTLGFDEVDEPTNEVEETVQKVVFSLEDDITEIEQKREEFVNEVEEETVVNEITSFSLNTEEEVEETVNELEETVSEINELEIPQDTFEEEEKSASTIVWNLHDEIEESENARAEENNDPFVFENKVEETAESEAPVYTNRIPDEDQLKRSQERILKIKELGMKMKTPSGINDLEKEPAYKRRQISLDSIPHSSENTISRFSLSDDEDGKPRLKDDNSFLHDNVD
ncbi:cell division protein FtsZ [Vicingus serpentipes]|uniref:Cell division protein FtsZ n=1 Tax=Vicingus serpentipes TaxID=1926625 RepID=A0A5C6RNJ1_9FLAO|nr:cell division protein FtsZ [Vicingus serpentipes]TXB63978.1 cell division protein FtsZ [Vicingus serpentipes]